MKISYNWLKQFIHLEEPPETIAEWLTAAGLEVEGIEKFESVPGGLAGLVTGEVVSKEKHPGADRLSLTKVDIGAGELLSIVCGAPNVEAGQKVVVAPVGTMLYPTEGEPFEIKKAKIRGERSEGMICAEDEIGLGQSHDGIMVLPDETKTGIPLAGLFDVSTDHVFEIGLTPNRADAASHLGVARDLKAILHQKTGRAQKLCMPSVDDVATGNGKLHIEVEVQNEEACPRYAGLTIRGITVKDSPEWLKNRLKAIGVRPINNVVDVTNYINHELGQPLHAFDAEKIAGNKVVVKTLSEGTAFTALDGSERKLSAGDLMICNASAGMCIAGVFGGAESGVSEKTSSIFLESAYFNPVWIRKTAKRHALHTDASFRFERGIDPNITVYALKRAAKLIAEIAGGTVSGALVDIYPSKIGHFDVTYRVGRANALMGCEVPANVTREILEDLEIEVISSDQEEWKLRVPPFKVDVSREVDVVEEVLRVYGYDKVHSPAHLRSSLTEMKEPLVSRARREVFNLLTGQGFLQAMSNSLTSSTYLNVPGSWPEEAVVRVSNPLSSELDIMRPTLLFNALENAAYNLNRQNEDVKLFEFGRTYHRVGEGFEEREAFSIVTTGSQFSENWRLPEAKSDHYFHRGLLELLMQKLGFSMDEVSQKESSEGYFEYGSAWYIQDKMVVHFGKINPSVARKFDLKKDVFYSGVHWQTLGQLLPKSRGTREIPKYPGVRRDLSLVVDKQMTFDALQEIARQSDRKLIRNINLFDVYEGKGLSEGKKSYALSFHLRSDERTLTDAEVDQVMEKLIAGFAQSGAELR